MLAQAMQSLDEGNNFDALQSALAAALKLVSDEARGPEAFRRMARAAVLRRERLLGLKHTGGVD